MFHSELSFVQNLNCTFVRTENGYPALNVRVVFIFVTVVITMIFVSEKQLSGNVFRGESSVENRNVKDICYTRFWKKVLLLALPTIFMDESGSDIVYLFA